MAQAIGRFGNWFNNELYGRRTNLPWGLKVYEMADGKAIVQDGQPVARPGLYHPTFLYESLWCLGVAILVWQLDKRYKFGRGRAFAVYVMAYTVGRFWVEALREDEANHFLGMRLNDWTSIVVFLAALIYFLRVRGPQLWLVPAEGENRYRAVPAEEAQRILAETGAAEVSTSGGTDPALSARRALAARSLALDCGPARGRLHRLEVRRGRGPEHDPLLDGWTALEDRADGDADEPTDHEGVDPPDEPASTGPPGTAAER